MKAFIHGIREDGTDYLGTGFPQGGIVTREYRTLKALLHNNLKYFTGKFHVEAFYDWNRKYGKADIDIIVESRKGLIEVNLNPSISRI